MCSWRSSRCSWSWVFVPLRCRHVPCHQGQVPCSCRLPRGTVVTAELNLFHRYADAQVSGCWRTLSSLVAHQCTLTCIKVPLLRAAKVVQVELEMGDALQGQSDAFIPSTPGLFFHSAEVLRGVPHGVPAACGGRAVVELSWAKACSCMWLWEE